MVQKMTIFNGKFDHFRPFAYKTLPTVLQTVAKVLQVIDPFGHFEFIKMPKKGLCPWNFRRQLSVWAGESSGRALKLKFLIFQFFYHFSRLWREKW